LGLAEQEIVIADAMHAADFVQVLDMPVGVLVGHPLVSMQGVQVLLRLSDPRITEVEEVG
jgi:hypothetical protein